MNQFYRYAFISVASVLTVSCATQPVSSSKTELVASNHSAGYELLKRAAPYIDPKLPIISVSFSSVDNLEKSSSFGRIASQQVASSFVNSGYTINEVLFRNSLYIKDGSGEFMLSRHLNNLALSHSIQAVIVGTYAVGKSEIYISSKIIDARNAKVIASNDYSMPLDDNMKLLLLND